MVKTRIQNANFGQNVSGFTVIKDMVRSEGPGAFFKGLTPKVSCGADTDVIWSNPWSLVQAHFSKNLNVAPGGLKDGDPGLLQSYPAELSLQRVDALNARTDADNG